MQSESTDMGTGTQEAWHPMTGRLASASPLQLWDFVGRGGHEYGHGFIMKSVMLSGSAVLILLQRVEPSIGAGRWQSAALKRLGRICEVIVPQCEMSRVRPWEDGWVSSIGYSEEVSGYGKFLPVGCWMKGFGGL